MKKEDSVFVSVVVKPHARRDEIIDWAEGVIRVHVKAPPREGEANEGCRRMLARAFGVPISRVIIRHGEGSRRKKVQITGVSTGQVERLRYVWLAHQVDAR
jgi:uncharacterized protein (TIGR00251 family)